MAVMTPRIITFLVGDPEQSLHFPFASCEVGPHPIYHIFSDTIFLIYPRYHHHSFYWYSRGLSKEVSIRLHPDLGRKWNPIWLCFQPGMKTNHHERMMYVFQCFFSSHVNDTDPTEKKMKERNLQFWIEFQHVSARVSLVKWFFSRCPVEIYTSPPRKELRLPNKLRQMEKMLPVLKWKRILGQISYTLENYHGI